MRDSIQQPAPAWRDGAVDIHRLHGIDRQIVGSRHLFFAGDATLTSREHDGLSLMRAGEWLGGGTFRNSLYVAPWAQLTGLRDLRLIVEASGDVRVRLACAVAGRPVDTLAEIRVRGTDRAVRELSLPGVMDLPDGARLFWHIDAHRPSRVHDVVFATRSTPLRQPRLAILMRTFGRTADVKALLSRFEQAGRLAPHHAAALDRMEFWLLDGTGDSTGDASASRVDLIFPELNLRIFDAPNLGGGGNASHLAQLFLDHCRAQPDPVQADEVLILDDDLSISFESLARYLAFCGFRSKEVVCSLPLLMQSQPTVVWEDGGLWGRFDPAQAGGAGSGAGPARSVFPTLLKHGVSLDGFDRLDEFGPLNHAEYATFVFFGLSRRSLERIGLPASFFLRGDDIELSLRAASRGVPVVTNPNLAAWHEPGHNHAQEYMAILHACIINLSYSDNSAEAYVAFFEERLYEHAAIGDGAGLAVYLEVLEQLISPQSPVLTYQFAAHYIDIIERFGHTEMARLPGAERERLEERTRESGGQVLPFLHAGYQRPRRGDAPVMLVNASRGEYRELKPSAFSAKSETMRRFVTAIEQFESGFAELRDRWQRRLQASGTEAFWQQVRDDHAGRTQLRAASFRAPFDWPAQQISRDERRVIAAAALPTETARTAEGVDDAGPLSLDELRERLALELQALSGLRSSLGLPIAPHAFPPDHPAAATPVIEQRRQSANDPRHSRAASHWGRLWAKLELNGRRVLPSKAAAIAEKKAASPPPEPLPADFEPEQYLALNVDVARSGVDAATHYLRFGRAEGRRYRRAGDPSLTPAYRKA